MSFYLKVIKALNWGKAGAHRGSACHRGSSRHHGESAMSSSPACCSRRGVCSGHIGDLARPQTPLRQVASVDSETVAVTRGGKPRQALR